MESLHLYAVAVLMPLDIKIYTVPHLKALTRKIEHVSEHGRGSTFKQCYTVLKSTISLHKRAKWWFHVTVAVGTYAKIVWGRISKMFLANIFSL